MISSAELLNAPIGFPPFSASELLTAGTASGRSAAFAGMPSATALGLAEAFTSFVSSSARLESSYRELQGNVAALRAELAERNAALRVSLSENERVRLALHKIVDSMPCGVLVATRSGTLTLVNGEAARLLGLPASGCGPASLQELEAQHGLDFRFTHLAENGADGEQEFCWTAADGQRWLHVQVRQLVSSEETSGLAILILRDVTAGKRAERDRELARNAKALAQVTSMLAHEIRNPLGSLELFAELIETDSDGRGEWISHLRAGIRSLSGTVNNVLTLHEPGTLPLQPLRLAETVTGLVLFAQPLADQASVTLRWADTAHPARVAANDSALRQVLLNLVRNAVRHTPAGGTITLSLQGSGPGQVVLACTDSGSGLPAVEVERLFQPGFSGAGDSPGLGLAVCDRIMQQHNGSISAHNVAGAGACFTLTFPVLEQELTAA